MAHEVKVCPGDTINLAATSTDPNFYEAWYTPSGDSIHGPVYLPQPDSSDFGYYYLYAKNDKCSAVQTVHVIDVPKLQVQLGTDTTICIGQTYDIPVNSGFYSYSWNTGEHTSSINVDSTGLYILEALYGDQCQSSDSVLVNFIDCSVVFGNVFTPNGDGKNDEFEIVYGNAQRIDLYIYNRWGKQVMHRSGTRPSWNGKDDGDNIMPQSSYFYVAHVIDYFGQPHDLKGTVELMR